MGCRKAQTWLFKTTGGKLGNKFLRGAEVGILTTTGRKSGEPRDSPLLFLQEGRRTCWSLSQGGRSTNPMWYLQPQGQPEGHVPDEAGHAGADGREATDAERDEYWPALCRSVNYRSYTERKIPIIICDPA